MIKSVFVFVLLIFSLSIFAQQKEDLVFSNRTYKLSDLFTEIHKQQGTEFSYTNELNTNQTILLPALNGSLQFFLDHIIDKKSFKTTLKENKVFLTYIPPEERKFRISGFVKDAETGEALINASIANLSNFTGTVSNSFGFYSLRVQNISHYLQYSFVGYHDVFLDVKLSKDTSITIFLHPKTLLNEVKVVADQKSNNINHLFVSSTSLRSKDLKNFGVFGENDLLQNLTHLPGVQMANEGLDGFSIRNGSPDQNLMLLDDVPVYYASHLLGLYSVFNSDAINQVKLVKGGFPARYGGRVSSVLDIRMKDGNPKKLSGNFSLGLITSKLALNGPLKKDKTTFSISARRSYLDLILNGIFKLTNSDLEASYYFGDLNVKLAHKFSNRDKIYFSTYWGGDLAKIKEYQSTSENIDEKYSNTIGWGNLTNSIRWNHIYNNHLFGNTTLMYSRYTFLNKEKQMRKVTNEYSKNYSYSFRSGIRDLSLKSEFDFIPDPKHYLKFGLEASLHYTKPGDEVSRNETQEQQNTPKDKNIRSQEINLFGECQIRFGKKFLVNIGSRWSNFFVENTYYSTLEPRFNTQYFFTPKWSVTSSFSQMTQYLHLVRSSSLSLPTDIWFPVTKKIKPINSFQYTAGTNYAFSKNLQFRAEFFHKLTQNVLQFKDSYYFKSLSSGWEKSVESGKNRTKGLEISLRKTSGKTSGTIAYTLSKAKVKFKEINNGKSFPSPYDRRHDFSIALHQKLNKKINCSVFWTYGTGAPVTISSTYVPAVSPYENNYATDFPVYYEKNAFRLPDYHRLDFSINFVKVKKRGIRTWNISLYNIYNRKNTNYMYVSSSSSNQKKYSLMRLSLFSFLPSISYSYKF